MMLKIINMYLVLAGLPLWLGAGSPTECIKEIYTMHDAQDVLNQADEKTLVLYDVDATLIIPMDKILWSKFCSVGPGKALKQAFEKKWVTAGIENDIWSMAMLQAQFQLVEPAVAATIKELQARKVKTLGLTKMRSGRFGTISSLADYRFHQLKKLGIEFWPSYGQAITFDQFAYQHEGFPLIYKGTIMTNETDKGAVLGVFIDCLDYTPTQVIFFDDLRENIVDVGDEMRKRGISYYGYHYRAAEIIPGELDYAVAQFQLDHLTNFMVWLSEEEARVLNRSCLIASQYEVPNLLSSTE
jgi:hypothetical protein